MTEATFTKLRTSAAFDVVGSVDRVYGWIQRLTAESQPSTVVHINACTCMRLCCKELQDVYTRDRTGSTL